MSRPTLRIQKSEIVCLFIEVFRENVIEHCCTYEDFEKGGFKEFAYGVAIITRGAQSIIEQISINHFKNRYIKVPSINLGIITLKQALNALREQIKNIISSRGGYIYPLKKLIESAAADSHLIKRAIEERRLYNESVAEMDAESIKKMHSYDIVKRNETFKVYWTAAQKMKNLDYEIINN